MVETKQPKYAIGQQAWQAMNVRGGHQVECPDCGGTGRLRVTFHDETTVSIECRNCAQGFGPPTGKVTLWDYTASAELVTIDGLEIAKGAQPRYYVRLSENFRQIIDEDCLFPTRDEALARAKEMGEEQAKEDNARILKKEKDTRSWAWNASYHRRCIAQAKQQIAHHESKLAVADLKAKAVAKRRSRDDASPRPAGEAE